ncbi:prepilin-type N-terminal cleavage/methylation domain-containing protein [Patescibacteria group bacterium]
MFNLKTKIIKKVKQNKFAKRICSELSAISYRLSAKKNGFSFLEMIIYITILTIVLSLVINLTLLMTKSYSNIKVSHNINNSAISIMERLTREIRWSDSVNEGSSVFGSDLGILVLNTIDESEEIVETRFYEEGGDFKIKQGIADANVLNDDNVSINKFLLTKVDTGISEMVKIELVLEGGWKDKIKSETFYNSIILRESY